MWACTFRRSSAISRWAALESSCVSANEVAPWTRVARRAPRAPGVSSPDLVLADDVVDQDLVEAGRTSPETRLIDHQDEAERQQAAARAGPAP